MLWPPAEVKVYNVALAMKYSISVALALKRLDIPGLKWFEDQNCVYYGNFLFLMSTISFRINFCLK